MNYQEVTGLAQALFEESDTPLFLLDGHAENVLDANAASQRLCGFSLREILASSVANLFKSKDRPGLRPMPARARRIHRSFALRRCQIRICQPATWQPIDITLSRLLVKPFPLTLLSLREVRMGGMSRPLRIRKPNGIAEGISDCFWSAEVLDNGEVRMHCVTPAVQRMTGRSIYSLGRDLQCSREIVYPEDRDIWDRAWERRRAGEATSDRYRIIGRDGQVHWVRECVSADLSRHAGTVWLFGVVSECLSIEHEDNASTIEAVFASPSHLP